MLNFESVYYFGTLSMLKSKIILPCFPTVTFQGFSAGHMELASLFACCNVDSAISCSRSEWETWSVNPWSPKVIQAPLSTFVVVGMFGWSVAWLTAVIWPRPIAVWKPMSSPRVNLNEIWVVSNSIGSICLYIIIYIHIGSYWNELKPT